MSCRRRRPHGRRCGPRPRRPRRRAVELRRRHDGSTATCSSPPSAGPRRPRCSTWPATGRSTTERAARFVPGGSCPTTCSPPAGWPATARSTSCSSTPPPGAAARAGRRPAERACARARRPSGTPAAARAIRPPSTPPRCSADGPTASSTSPRTSPPRTSSAAVGEGYDSVELVKRYTTATMGPAQGKLETVNAVAVLAEATGPHASRRPARPSGGRRTPRSRSARSAGRTLEPVRHSPMQPWHERHGAVPLVAGPVDPARPLRRPRRRGPQRAHERRASSTSPRSASSTCAGPTCRSCSTCCTSTSGPSSQSARCATA